MKKIFIHFAAILIALTFFACNKTPKIDSSTWTSDFDGAKAAAAKEGKDILMIIGSGDENPSENPNLGYPEFKSEVLLSEEFISRMTEKYVLVNFEFNETIYQNVFGSEDKAAEKLLIDAIKYANFYAVDHLPAVSILTEEGFIETQFYLDEDGNSLPKDTDEFIARIDEYSEDILAAKSLIAATKTGSAEEKIAAMDNFYEMTRPDVKNTTVEMSRKIVALDKNNKSGLVSKHLFAIANADFFAAIYADDQIAALTSIERICENKNLTPDEKQELYFTYPYMLAQNGFSDYAVLKKYFQKSYDVAPNSEHAAQVKGIIDYLDMIQSGEPSPAAEIVEPSTVATPEAESETKPGQEQE